MAQSKELARDLLRQARKIDDDLREVDYLKTFTATIIGAMSFIAGLFWRDVINGMLDFFPELPGLVGEVISAVIVTAIFVLIIVKMKARTHKLEKKLKSEKKKLDEEKLG